MSTFPLHPQNQVWSGVPTPPAPVGLPPALPLQNEDGEINYWYYHNRFPYQDKRVIAPPQGPIFTADPGTPLLRFGSLVEPRHIELVQHATPAYENLPPVANPNMYANVDTKPPLRKPKNSHSYDQSVVFLTVAAIAALYYYNG